MTMRFPDCWIRMGAIELEDYYKAEVGRRPQERSFEGSRQVYPEAVSTYNAMASLLIGKI